MRIVLLVGLTVVGTLNCKSSSNPDAAVSRAPVVEKGMCDEIDDTNLQAAAECLYRAKTLSDQWRLLSTAYQKEEQGPLDAGTTFVTHNCVVTDIKVTKEESVAGSVFAAVSRTVSCQKVDGGVGCSKRGTRTWIKEGMAWRLHGGSGQMSEVADKKFQAGDYAGAAAAAEEWLKMDPFSVDAYYRLGFSVLRGAGVRSTSDVARAALAIDSSNSTALTLAIALTSDPDVRESYLRRIAPDDCELAVAVSNVALGFIDAHRAQDALALLDRYPQFELSNANRRIGALRQLKQWTKLVAYLTGPVTARMRQDFDWMDPTYAANQSAMIADALIAAGRPEMAREWIDYGLLKDPTDGDLATLLRKLKK